MEEKKAEPQKEDVRSRRATRRKSKPPKVTLGRESSQQRDRSASLRLKRENSMLDLMTWQEVVDQLKTEGQFQMVIMFDLKGQIIASTDGAVMEQGDAIGLLKTMDANSNTISGLFVSGSKFSCLTIDKDSVVGRAYSDILSAYRNTTMLVCAIGERRDDYSCLGFIKTFLSSLNTDDKTKTLDMHGGKGGQPKQAHKQPMQPQQPMQPMKPQQPLQPQQAPVKMREDKSQTENRKGDNTKTASVSKTQTVV